MSIKIRCPHCRRVLSAEEDTIGEPRRCPACGGGFTVPIPIADAPVAARDVRKCVRCGGELSPTAAVCRRCFTDQSSGQRIPFKQRLIRGSLSAWITVGGIVAVIAIGGFVGIQSIRDATRKRVAPYVAPATPQINVKEIVGRLFAARNEKTRIAARDEILQADVPLGAELLDGLIRSLANAGEAWEKQGQLTALELLGTRPNLSAPLDDAAQAALVRAERDSLLRGASIRARNLLGDNAALRELLDLWLAQGRAITLIDRLIELTPRADVGQLTMYRDMLRGEGARSTRVLKQLVARGDALVLEALGDDAWRAWTWLGQLREEAIARKLFELAKPEGTAPASGSKLDFDKEEIRGGRRALQQMAERGSPRAAAAAAIVLLDCTPQYESLRKEILTKLAHEFGSMRGEDQQIVGWAIARLTNRTFGAFSAANHPLDMSTKDRDALLDWARREHGATRPDRATELSGPPVLELQIVSAKRQLESDLLANFGGDAAVSDAAIGSWIDERLGWTPRLDLLIDAAQHSPDRGKLAAAITLAGVTGPARLRTQLDLWRRSPDLAADIRGLAYLALGVLDARTGEHASEWPRNFTLELSQSDVGVVTWAQVGKLVAAGGRPVLDALEKSGALSAAQMATLSEAIRRERAAGRFVSESK